MNENIIKDNLKSKKPFLYEVDGEYFIISCDKVINYKDVKEYSLNLVNSYLFYKESVNYNEKYRENMISIMVECKDLINRNINKYIKDFENFWNELSNENKQLIYIQLEKFSNLHYDFKLD